MKKALLHLLIVLAAVAVLALLMLAFSGSFWPGEEISETIVGRPDWWHRLPGEWQFESVRVSGDWAAWLQYDTEGHGMIIQGVYKLVRMDLRTFKRQTVARFDIYDVRYGPKFLINPDGHILVSEGHRARYPGGPKTFLSVPGEESPRPVPKIKVGDFSAYTEKERQQRYDTYQTFFKDGLYEFGTTEHRPHEDWDKNWNTVLHRFVPYKDGKLLVDQAVPLAAFKEMGAPIRCGRLFVEVIRRGPYRKQKVLVLTFDASTGEQKEFPLPPDLENCDGYHAFEGVIAVWYGRTLGLLDIKAGRWGLLDVPGIWPDIVHVSRKRVYFSSGEYRATRLYFFDPLTRETDDLGIRLKEDPHDRHSPFESPARHASGDWFWVCEEYANELAFVNFEARARKARPVRGQQEEKFEECIRSLSPAYTSDQRAVAAGTLGEIGDPRAVPHLIKAYRADERELAPQFWLRTLGGIPCPEAETFLLDELKAGRCLGTVIKSLGGAGTERSLRPVEDALAGTKDDGVRKAAEDALRRIRLRIAGRELARRVFAPKGGG